MYKYGQHLVSSICKGLLPSSNEADTNDEEDKKPRSNARIANSSSNGQQVPFSPGIAAGARKRKRHGGNATPSLVLPAFADDEESVTDETSTRTTKRARQDVIEAYEQMQSPLLSNLPDDVIRLTISFVHDSTTRPSLQATCRKFLHLSNDPSMLKRLNLFGDPKTGYKSILNSIVSPEDAIERLLEFSRSGNVEAKYMIGMIVTYCFKNKVGISLLKNIANKGYLRAKYALGIILRDISKDESDSFLKEAVDAKFLPACQEILSSQEVKEQFGDLTAPMLRRFFDPVGLNRLLSRCYLQCNEVRKVNSSHCWNPLCGRWAFKQHNGQGVVAPALSQSPQHVGNYLLPPLGSDLEANICTLIPPQEKEECDVESQELKEDKRPFRVSRMKMCSSCRRAKYCSKLCQVYDWRSGRHKMECQYL